MPLGKGLSSLIPKKTNIQQPPQEENFATSKSPQPIIPLEEKPAVLLEKNQQPNKEEVGGFRAEALGAPPSLVSDEVGIGGARAQAAARRWSEPTAGSVRKPATDTAIFHIEVDKIKPNPHQPRRNFDETALKELAASIQEFGILQPLVVSKIEKENEMGTSVEYELIAGERRLMAAKMLGWERVPAIIRKIFQKSEQLELAVIENLQRENLNPVETARAYAKLQDEFGITQREIATRLGKSRETIANTLRLLNLPTEIQDAVAKGQINESQARLLLIIEEPLQQQNLFKELLNNSLSVRQLRQRVGKKGKQTTSDMQHTTVDPEIVDLQEKLTELLGADVKINPPAGVEKSGKIVITFYSPEEIQGIIDKISSNDKIE